jgi:hypothetical protein
MRARLLESVLPGECIVTDIEPSLEFEQLFIYPHYLKPGDRVVSYADNVKTVSESRRPDVVEVTFEELPGLFYLHVMELLNVIRPCFYDADNPPEDDDELDDDGEFGDDHQDDDSSRW